MPKKLQLGPAVIYGTAAWLAYALVEFILFSLVPLAGQSDLVLSAPFWHAMSMLFVTYAVIGAVLAAISAGLVQVVLKDGQAGTQASLLAGTLPLPIAFVANLLFHWPLTGAGAITVLVGILLISAMVANLRSSDWSERTSFVTGPFAVSTLLLLPSWIGNEIWPTQSNAFRLTAIVLSTVAVLLVFHPLGRLRKWTGESRPHRYALTVVAATAVCCIAGLALGARMPGLPPRDQVKADPARRPNVVLVVMDTVRADHTSLYGYQRDTTPFLRQLSQQATLYKRTVAVSDMTLSTHASIFTGLYPRTHGAHYAMPTYPYGRPLAERFSTMPELLLANGYRTMAAVANTGYVSKGMGLSQGFELFDARTPVALGPSLQVFYLRRQVRALLDRFISTIDFEPVTRRAGEINHDAFSFLDQLGNDSPFFLFVNYMDAHDPYSPPAPFDSKYPCADPKVKRLEQYIKIRNDVMSSKRPFTPQEQECWMSGYDGGIAYLDTQIRNLVESLQARGLYDNTLLIVVGDHGESFGQKNQLGHGVSVHQDEIGVPLLVKYPHSDVPSQVDAMVSQVDLLPTVLDVTSVPEPPGLQGSTLRKIEQRDSHFVVSAAYPDPWLIREDRRYDRIEEALLFNHQKLVQSTAGKRELYNLSTDAGEADNLYREGDPEALALTKMLEEFHRNIPSFVSSEAPGKDRETLDRLKSLGYAQ